MTNQRAYGERIEAARKAKSWSRVELGRRVDRTPQAIFTWERQGRMPHAAVRRKLEELLGVKPPV